MNSMLRRVLVPLPAVALFLGLGLGAIEAKKKARKPPEDLPTFMTERGDPVLLENFDGGAVPEAWKPGLGTWEIEDGALKGVEKAADDHVATIRTMTGCTDVIIQFSFMFKGGRVIGLTLNNKDGHVCSMGITPTGFRVSKDRPRKESEEKGELLDSTKVEFKEGQWYDIVVEILGNEMLASISDKKKKLNVRETRLVIHGSHEGVAKPKTNFGFYAGGVDQAIYYDDVRVWQSKPNKKWKKTQKKLAMLKEYLKQRK